MQKYGVPFVWPIHFRRLLLIALSLMLLCAAGGAEGGRVVHQEADETQLSGSDGLDLFLLPLIGADAMLLHSQGQWMMVDMGKEEHYPLIRETLEEYGVRRIDILLNTHPHSDHIGSAGRLADDYEIGRFVTAFPHDYAGLSVLQAGTIKHMNTRCIPIDQVDDGDSFSFGGAICQVMRVPPGGMYNTNNASALLLIRHGDTRMLLAADVAREGQRVLAAQYGKELKADLLKYPHHGLEKLLPDFQDAVAAAFALIPHGHKDSRYAREVLDKQGTPYLFASWGRIHVQSDGQQLTITQLLSEHGKEYHARTQRALKYSQPGGAGRKPEP